MTDDLNDVFGKQDFISDVSSLVERIIALELQSKQTPIVVAISVALTITFGIISIGLFIWVNSKTINTGEKVSK